MLDNFPRGTICIEDIEMGMIRYLRKQVTDRDIELFAEVSTDRNPVHLDEEYAQDTMFHGRIAHGMLTGSLISTVLGMKLPGPGCIYISQNLKFLAPVRAGDTAEVHAVITEIIPEKRRIVMKTTVHVGDTLVVDGEAKMMVRSRGDSGDD